LLNIYFMRQRTGSITDIQQSGFMKQTLRQCFYLFEKSFDSYGKLRKSRAPDILVDAEKVLVRRRLIVLFNIETDEMN
jgi:hypothetical protein